MSSSQPEGSNSEMVHQQRPVMSADLFIAAIKGNEDVLIQCLGLPKEQHEVMVTVEASHSVQSEVQSATCLGDTVLHLLVVNTTHNELALKVFQRDRSLLKAQNKKLETPLHLAAKAGNKEVIKNLIRIDPAIVKDALQETDENGDTALHVVALHGHINVGSMLMNFYPKMAYKVNKEMSSPLYITIVNGYTEMVKTMLTVDPNLTCTQFSDGMFPIHVAAREGNVELVMHFMKKYPDDAELLDPHGRNLFHIAAKEEHDKLFMSSVFEDTSVREMIKRMNNAMDYEGNTPLHIAAMLGHRFIIRKIWIYRRNQVAENTRNNKGLTPLNLSGMQLLKTTEYIDDDAITEYVATEGHKFTQKWFDEVMVPSVSDKWERTQVIGLGSVLITTVTFAATFTIPGGYDQDHGTPILGRRYMFWAFILANALSFIQGFLSLFAVLINALPGMPIVAFEFALIFFLLAASSMVVAFGLGVYVTLAPVCLPIAILLLVITLPIGSPALLVVFVKRKRYIGMVINLLGHDLRSIVATYIMSLLLIFSLAALQYL